MTDLVKCNKINGVYWLKHPIEDLRIRIKVKQQDSIVLLPKFEEFTQSKKVDTQSLNTKTNEYHFKWQEKVFSRWETTQYINVHNCLTDTELGYHKQIERNQYKSNQIFTYINEDYHLPLPFEMKTKLKNSNIPNLNSCFEKLNLDMTGRDFNVTNSMTHLFRSNDNVSSVTEQWMAMHVVYDNSQYSEDSQLLYKQEHILSSIYYNVDKNFIILSPDTNDLELNPYTASTHAPGMLYSMEVDFGGANGEELVMLLHKLHKKWEKKQKNVLKFTMPPLGKRKIYMSFEIISAKDFDLDNIYIEYHIKIPDTIECSGPLQGNTHTSSALKTDVEEWMYGHLIDLEMDIATGLEPPPIKIYLEAISVDWWGRHRTEGYTRLALTPAPGRYTSQLSCSRPDELDRIEADSRRLYVGGCHLLKDLTVLDRRQNAKFLFVTTGTIQVRWDVITQSPTPACPPSSLGGNASSALRGADEAIRRYKRARGKLAAVTGDIAVSANLGQTKIPGNIDN